MLRARAEARCNPKVCMKRIIRLLLLATCVVCGGAGCRTPGEEVGAWEYKVLDAQTYGDELERQLNELARQGWSVVSVSTSFQGVGELPFAVAVLQRPRRD